VGRILDAGRLSFGPLGPALRAWAASCRHKRQKLAHPVGGASADVPRRPPQTPGPTSPRRAVRERRAPARGLERDATSRVAAERRVRCGVAGAPLRRGERAAGARGRLGEGRGCGRRRSGPVRRVWAGNHPSLSVHFGPLGPALRPWAASCRHRRQKLAHHSCAPRTFRAGRRRRPALLSLAAQSASVTPRARPRAGLHQPSRHRTPGAMRGGWCSARAQTVTYATTLVI
jgi:hypothetical protein